MPTNNAKGILENLSRGMRMAEWKMSPPASTRCDSDDDFRVRSSEIKTIYSPVKSHSASLRYDYWVQGNQLDTFRT